MAFFQGRAVSFREGNQTSTKLISCPNSPNRSTKKDTISFRGRGFHFQGRGFIPFFGVCLPPLQCFGCWTLGASISGEGSKIHHLSSLKKTRNGHGLPVKNQISFWSKTHRIHVWYIYLHLVNFYGKCRQIYHTWILWEINGAFFVQLP